MDQRVRLRRSFFQRMQFDARLPEDFVRSLWNAPADILEQGQVLKQSASTTVARIPLLKPTEAHPSHGDDGSFAVLKEYKHRGLSHAMGHLFWFTRASCVWKYGRLLDAAGISTPRPLAVIERRLGPFRLGSYVLTEFVPGTTLDQLLAQGSLSDDKLERLARQFADFWWKLADLRITHGDLKPGNLLVTPDTQLVLIDLDGTRRCPVDSFFDARRRRDWHRFQRCLPHRADVVEVFRSAIQQHAGRLTVPSRAAA